MEKLANSLFSMRSMAVAMFVFLVSIAWATILESQYDTETAKLLIYNATWFEILLVFLSVNLISNIFTYKMYRSEKFAMFMFHVSFLIILTGAGITRFFSFEGQMPIEEGTDTNVMYSAEPYIQFEIRDEKKQLRNRIIEKKYMSEVVDNDFTYEVNFPDRKPILIEYVKFEKNMIDSLVSDKSIKESSLEFNFQGKPFHVSSGSMEFMNTLPVYYNKDDGAKGLSITETGTKLMMRSFETPIRYLEMSKLTVEDRQDPAKTDSLTQTHRLDTTIQLQKGVLYTVAGAQFVYTEKLANTTKKHLKAEKKNSGTDELTVMVKDGDVEKEVTIKGGINSYGSRQGFILNGLVYELNYCRKPIELPFSVGCVDFQLDRYPGSMSPSSFASELYIKDDREDAVIKKRVFMNNVIDHDGYRFFQASYFPDESGTILSVNHDWWGTNVTYFGYLLMSIAMLMSIFAKSGRLRGIIKN